ncbi:iron ABC transporter permease [Demequina sp. B12]|uniref:ABC transporter permease n=1 Tax=Demequina sp. B12 TaxID=2992757 RepID=UPI00237C4934|nr:iron ABC transporter permease [Demequina sp. B12]MDE0572298.1 iron ABC transporter permease [Demequina sp. B12]
MPVGRRLTRHLTWWGLAAVPLVFLGVFFVWPLLTVLIRGLWDGGFDWAGTWAVVVDSRTADALVTTALLASLGTAGSLALGIPGAYVLYRLRWRGQATVRGIAAVPFVLPTIVVATAFTALLGRSGPLAFLGWDQSVWAIALAMVFYNTAVVMRIVGGTWASLDPRTADAARTLGANRRQAWWHVTVPALMPAVASAASVVFLFCATSFGVVLVMGGTRINTIETEIWLQVNQYLDMRAAAVLSVIQLAFVVGILAVSAWARRRRERVLGTRTVDGTRPATVRDLRVMVPVLTVLGLLMAAPLFSLVERSLRIPGGHGIDHYVALFTDPPRSVLPVSVWQATMNSLVTAVIAAGIATALGLIVAALNAARGRRAATLDALVMMPLGVSSVVVGLGMLLTLNRSVVGFDLRGSWWLVAFAQAVVALPLVVRTLIPQARAIDPRMRSAASTLGARPWRVWASVDWPLLRRPFGLALGFAFAISLGEFGATSFLARPDRPTLPTAIFRLLGRPGLENMGMAFAAAVLLAFLTAGIMMTSERMRTTVGGDL